MTDHTQRDLRLPYTEKAQPGYAEGMARILRSGSIPVRTISLNDPDPILFARIKHVMKKGEQFGEFFSRTGLGKSQALSMSKSEISAFVEQSERNAQDEVSAPPMTVSPKYDPPQNRFCIVPE